MSAIARLSWSVISRIREGISVRSASSDARIRRSPATSSNLAPPRGRTSTGWSTPRALMEAERSLKPLLGKLAPGLVRVGRYGPRWGSCGPSEESEVFCSSSRTPPKSASKPRPRPLLPRCHIHLLTVFAPCPLRAIAPITPRKNVKLSGASMSDHIHELFDKDGNSIGALLSAEAWSAVKTDVLAKLGIAEDKPIEVKPEPIADWETLKEYWGFPVPAGYGCRLRALRQRDRRLVRRRTSEIPASGCQSGRTGDLPVPAMPGQGGQKALQRHHHHRMHPLPGRKGPQQGRKVLIFAPLSRPITARRPAVII